MKKTITVNYIHNIWNLRIIVNILIADEPRSISNFSPNHELGALHKNYIVLTGITPKFHTISPNGRRLITCCLKGEWGVEKKSRVNTQKKGRSNETSHVVIFSEFKKKPKFFKSI